jgi:hypothetical protein
MDATALRERATATRPDPAPTLTPQELPAGLAELAPGPALSALLAGVDPGRLTAHQLVTLIAARNRQIAFEQAQLLLALRELGLAPPGQRTAVVRDAERNPFANVEAAFGTTWTVYRCDLLMSLARFIFDDAPALGQALAAGRVDLDKVKVFDRALSGVTEPDLAREIVAQALSRAERDNTATLRTRLQRILAQRDPDSIRKRRERDHHDRFVDRYTERDTGLVSLIARFCDPAAATAAYEHIDAIAKTAKAAGDPSARTMDQLRHDILLDLLAGCDPATAGHATPADRKGTIIVHIDLATLGGIQALLGPVGAHVLGQALHARAGHPHPCGHPHPGDRLGILAGVGQRDSSAVDAEQAGCARCRAELADLLNQPGQIAGYGPVPAYLARQSADALAQTSRWRYAVDDDGQLIAEGALPKDLLPDLIQHMRRWAVDASAGPDGRAHYRPTTAQIAFARARDRRCQAPGCRVPAHKCQIDHRIPWHNGGPTFIDNLYCLCARHHRAKDEAGHAYQPIPGGIA